MTETSADLVDDRAGGLDELEDRGVAVADGAAEWAVAPLQPDSNMPAATNAAVCRHLTW